VEGIMRIKVTFKTPDAIESVIGNYSEDEQEEIREHLSAWIEYGEYIYIEFDTEKANPNVLRVK
jgi:hypothetical protein